MSGRPRGPYTVKKRRPATLRPYRWLYVWAISSQLFLVAAYGDTGKSTTSFSLNTFVAYSRYIAGEAMRKARWGRWRPGGGG